MSGTIDNTAPVAPEPEYSVEDQIGFVLRRTHQRASAIFETVMGGFQVTPTQFTTLIKLQDLGEVSQNRLGRMAAMDPATTFGVISRLKKRDLITQRTDPNDARRILLRLTQEGDKCASAMRVVAVQVSQEILAPLTGDEQEMILKLLGKLM
jgi:MarR family transcriptional regulator, lower aerobic nicotinate degradation pathway regulator